MKRFHKFLTKFISITFITALFLPLSSNVYAAGEGTLNVTVVPSTGTYEVLDDITEQVVVSQTSGSQPFQLNPGYYRIDYKNIGGGWTAPASEEFFLAAGGTVDATGIYNGGTNEGTLNIDVTPETGKWDLKDGNTGAVILANRTGDQGFLVPYGFYIVDFKDIGAAYLTPADVPVVIDSSNPVETAEGVYINAPNPGTVNVDVTPNTGSYKIVDDITEAVVKEDTGDKSFPLSPGYYRIDYNPLAGYTAPVSEDFFLAANGTVDLAGVYTPILQTGNINIVVQDNNSQPITDGSWILYSCTDVNNINSCTVPYSSGTATTPLANVPVGIYGLKLTVTQGYSGAVVTSLNPQTLTSSTPLTFTAQYSIATNVGTVKVFQLGANGRIKLDGPSPMTIVNAVYQDSNALPGSYTASVIEMPIGGQYVIDYVTDKAGLTINPPYTQVLSVAGEIVFNVKYKSIGAKGTVVVNQNRPGGSVQLDGPTSALVSGATYSNSNSGVGDYLLDMLTPPTGYVLDRITDGTGATLSTPYNQTLASGATITYNILYKFDGDTGTVTVNQTGATGTVALAGPSYATVTTPTYTDGGAGVGAYTLTSITPPAGFLLDRVTDGTGATLVSPYTQTLTSGATVTYNVAYKVIGDTGTLTVNQTGATGSLNVVGPSPVTVTTATYTNGLAGVGTYTLAGITPPVGFVLDKVTNTAGSDLTAPYTQLLAKDATITFNVIYKVIGDTGTVNVNQTGATGSMQLNGPTPAVVTTASYTNGTSGVGSYSLTGITPPAGYVLDIVTDGTGATLTAPYTQLLAKNATITYTVAYRVIGDTGTLNVNQTGATGSVDVNGPSPATVITPAYTNGTAGVGSYSLSNITPPAGFVLDKVTDFAGATLVAPYTQVLAKDATVTYNVVYKVIGDTGIINVNQTGATGTLNLVGPSPATVTTATYTNGTAGVGSYTLTTITPPAGFALDKVTDFAGATLVAPYTQVLATGASVTYNVAYVLISGTGTIQINVVDDGGNAVSNGSWTLSDATTGTATSLPLTRTAGSYTLTAVVPAVTPPELAYTGVNITPNATQTLAAGGSITFTVTYVRPATAGTVNINVVDNLGAQVTDGSWTLTGGTSPATGAASDTLTVANGSYTLTAVVPAGNLNYSSVTVAPTGAQTLAAGGLLSYTVTYVRANTGTIQINVVDDGGNAVSNGSWTLSDATTGTASTPTPLTRTAGSYTLIAVVPAVTPPELAYTGVNITPNATQTLTAGGAITYTVTYTRPATAGTVNINVVDNLGAQVTDGSWTLTGGTSPATGAASDTLTVANGSYTLTAVVPAGNLNYSSVTVAPAGAQTLAAGGLLSYTVTYVRVTGANIDLAATSFALATTSNPLAAGNLVTYEIRYANLSTTNTATAVTIDIDYDQAHGIATVPVGCTDNTPSAGIMRCLVANLAPGATGLLPFVYTVNSGLAVGTLINHSAVISSANPDNIPANNTATVSTALLGPVTLTKTVNIAGVSDNQLVTYTIKLKRNIVAGGTLNLTITDSYTPSDVLVGSNGGTFTYLVNSGHCTGVTCSGQNINDAPISVALDNATSEATIDYQARSSYSGIPAGSASLVTNTATATDNAGVLPVLTSQSSVSISGPGIIPPVTPSGGGGGGGGGGSVMYSGEMKLDIQKMVSLDGQHYTNAGKTLSLAIPENKSTTIYTKVLIKDLSKFSATNIKLEHAFDEGKSDITAGTVKDVVGATFKNNVFTIDKVKVGETYQISYILTVTENGANKNPAKDRLTLKSFKNSLPFTQDSMTYVGIGDEFITNLFAGSVPPSYEESTGEAGQNVSEVLIINVQSDKTNAAIGDTVNFTATLENVSGEDLTGLFIDHKYDPNAFNVVEAPGAKDDFNGIHWKRPILRSGETLTLTFSLKVKDSAHVGDLVHGLTSALVNEFSDITPVENLIRIVGGPASTGGTEEKPYELAATGPVGIISLMMLLSAIGYLGFGKFRTALYIRKKKLAIADL